MDDSEVKTTKNFPVLTTSNYLEWIDIVQDYLTSKGLLKYIDNEPLEAKPEEKKDDSKGVAFIKAYAGELRTYLIGIRTTKAALRKLDEVCRVSQSERVASLLSRFYGMRALSSIDLTASKLTQLQAEIGVAAPTDKPSDEAKKAKLIDCLSDEYRSTVFALKASGVASLSYETVVQRLRDVELSLSKDDEEVARYSKESHRSQGRHNRNERQSDSKRTKPVLTCYYCSKPGHIKRDCRKMKADTKKASESKNRGPQSRKDNKQPESQDYDLKNGDLSAVAWTAIDPTSTIDEYIDEPTDDNIVPSREDYGSTPIARRAIEDLGPNKFVLDTGATRHMSYTREAFVSLQGLSGSITIADGNRLATKGVGDIEVLIEGRRTRIYDVLYVPDLRYNLLSVARLADREITCVFSKHSVTLRRKNELLATGKRYCNTYILGDSRGVVRVASEATEATNSTSRLWHRRLGHPGNEKLLEASKALDGIPDLTAISECDTCYRTKTTRQQNHSPEPRATRHLERVYIDFWGPYKYRTIAGNRYMFTITDDYSRKSWIYLSKTRDAVYAIFKAWKAEVELETSEQLKAVRRDNAKELVKLADSFPGVIFEPTIPYTPEQNGVAERLNRTLLEKARALLAAAGLPKFLWGEAVHTACYLKNLTPIQGIGKTPEELWSNRRPSVTHLRVFGCLVYPSIPKERQDDKLSDRAFRGVFVGYTRSTKQYRVYNPTTRAISLHSSLRFLESEKGLSIDSTALRDTYPLTTDLPESVFDIDDSEDDILARETTNELDDTDRTTTTWTPTATTTPTPTPSEEDNIVVARPRRANRVTQAPRTFANEFGYLALRTNYESDEDLHTPQSIMEAESGPQSRQWIAAKEEHLASLYSNGTWSVVDAPEGINRISTKWVFKIKLLPNRQIDKFKMRLCARGFSQQYGIDYFETFSPVVRLESLRMLLAIGAIYDYEIEQMDIVSAYLISKLEDELYLETPEGVSIPEGKVLRLNKSIPGLKQSGRVWNKTIDKFFEEYGLYAIPADPCVFVTKDKRLIVALYVDDLLILGKEIEEIKRFKQDISNRFDIKDLGAVSLILGIQVTRDRARGTITLDQSHYLREILKEHGIEEGKQRVSIPSTSYESFAPAEAESLEPPTDPHEFQRLTGKLNWLVRGTRADIAYTTRCLSQIAANPTVRHRGGAMYLLRYLANTTEYSITYLRGSTLSYPEGYADADFATDQSRKSVSGYVFLLAGGPISWSSKLQRSVTTSTTEAEYVALSYAAKEAVYVRRFLSQIGYENSESKALTLYGDNKGAIALAKNPEFHARTKHIDVAIHYVRELVDDRIVSIEYIPTGRQLADCLTKPLPRLKHYKNVQGLRYTDDNDE